MQHKIFLKQLLLLLLLMSIFGFWSVHLGQDVNWDLQNYHFYNPYAFLHHRLNFDIAPAMLQTYFNPTFDLINYFLIVTQKPVVVAFLLGTISAITAFFIYKMGELFLLSRWLILFAVFIGMTGYASVVQLGATTNETKSVCLLTIALYLILKALRQGQKTLRLLLTGGLLAGFAIGGKLTAATAGLGLIASLIFIRPANKSHLLALVVLFFSIGAGFLISNAYWMWTLYQHFHNPLFPFYNNIFHSPYANAINYKDMRFFPKDMWQTIFLPFYYVKKNHISTELSMRDPRLAVAFVFILSFFFMKGMAIVRKKTLPPLSLELKFLLITFLVTYVSWLAEFAIYRYVVILEILSGLLIAFFIGYFFKRSVLQRSMVIILAIFIQSDTLYSDWGHISFGANYFVSSPLPKIPSEALVLLVGEYPIAYSVPFLASENRVLGVANAFMQPENQNKLQAEENHLINNFKGLIYSITVEKFNDTSIKSLSFYHLQQEKSKCMIAHTRIKALLVCPLRRIN